MPGSSGAGGVASCLNLEVIWAWLVAKVVISSVDLVVMGVWIVGGGHG